MSLTLRIVSWLLVALTGLLVARLARVAQRERSLPEAMMALFFLGGSIGYAALMLPGTLGLGPEATLRWATVSNFFFMLPSTAVAIFTWIVFRRDAAWGRTLGIGIAVTVVGMQICGYVLSAMLSEAELAASSVAAGLYWVGTTVRAASFGWAALESTIHWSKARRQLRLGLADPLVVNRFLLFATWSCMAALMLVFRVISPALAFERDGRMTEPVWFVIGQMMASIVCLLAVWFTFAAPRFYKRFVTGRATT